jgi:hypothetical protein
MYDTIVPIIGYTYLIICALVFAASLIYCGFTDQGEETLEILGQTFLALALAPFVIVIFVIISPLLLIYGVGALLRVAYRARNNDGRRV